MHYFGNPFFGPHLMGAAYMTAPYPLLGLVSGGIFAFIILLAVVWTLIWKGLALWHAARNRQTAWFVVMLIVNTLGVLEIIYLLFFRKDRTTFVAKSETKTTVTTEAVKTDPSSLPDLSGRKD